MSFSANLGNVFDFPKLKAFCGAHCDACGFKPLVHPIHAVIAFDGFADLRIPLRCSPGAGGNARFASHTQIKIDKYNAIFGSPLHGAGGTGCQTPGILAMKTGHENIGSFRQTSHECRPYLNNLADFRPHRQAFIAFALNRARMTPDTFFGVLK
jgi:hypothetical protein